MEPAIFDQKLREQSGLVQALIRVLRAIQADAAIGMPGIRVPARYERRDFAELGDC
jgi:hypothetical protein